MGRRPGRSATAAVVALIVTPFLMFCVIYAMNSLLSQQESVPTTETPEHEIPKQTSGEQGKEEDATINVSMADESVSASVHDVVSVVWLNDAQV